MRRFIVFVALLRFLFVYPVFCLLTETEITPTEMATIITVMDPAIPGLTGPM